MSLHDSKIVTLDTQQLSYAVSKGGIMSVFVHSHTVW